MQSRTEGLLPLSCLSRTYIEHACKPLHLVCGATLPTRKRRAVHVRTFYRQSDLGRDRRPLSANDERTAGTTVCPTDPVDVVTAQRQLVTMRWGLVPWWWS